MRRFIIWLAAVLSGVLLLIIAFAMVLQTEWTKHFLTQQASEAAGRPISIDGDLSFSWSLKPLVSAEAIRVENAPWGTTEHMVTIERLAVRINLLELLRLRVKFSELEIINPIVVLEKNGRGVGNWNLGIGTATEESQESNQDIGSKIPVIGSLYLENGRLTYRGPAQDNKIELAIHQLNVREAESDKRLKVEGEGRYNGKPLSLNGNAGSLDRLGDDGESYPVYLSVKIGETKASVDGSIMRPLSIKEVDADLSLSGPDLAALPPMAGMSLPPSPPYSLAGHLVQHGDVWDFTNVSGQIGESDLSGDIKVDLGQKRPFLSADLASRQLRFEDLRPIMGSGASQQSSDEANGEEPGRVLPSGAIELKQLQTMNARIVFSGQEILAPGLPLNELKITAELNDGRLVLEPLKLGVANGTVGGKIVLDGQGEQPRIETGLEIMKVSVKPLFEATEYFDNTTGLIGGKLELRGAGHSIDKILAASDGRLAVAMTGGSFSAFAIEAMGLDLGEILAVELTETDGVPIRCLVGELPIASGIAKPKTLVLDTTDAQLIGGGQINLAKETIDAEILSYPKDPSFLSVQRPVAVNGTFSGVEFNIGSLPLGTKGSPSAAREGAMAAVAGMTRFTERALGVSNDCSSLLDSARSSAK